MECLTDQAKVSKRVTSFTTPLGATVNMDGTALYECVAVIFLMQFFGLEISFASQFTIVALALLTSIGVAGIPAASLVAILIILNAVGMPEASIGIGVALLQFTDRILDMCRTAVNVFGDSCGAVLIARSEGEETALK
jgi:Na+/H+-dicarboxylate symporter